MNKKTDRFILQFMNYKPAVYSGFDKNTIALAKEMRLWNYTTVFVYTDSIQKTPALQHDIAKTNSVIELIDTTRGQVTTFLQILKLFRKYHPDLIHMHFDDLKKIMIVLCNIGYRVPLENTIHSQVTTAITPKSFRNQKGILKYLLFIGYHRFLINSSTNSLSVSEIVKNHLIGFIGKKRNLRTLYLGTRGPIENISRAQMRKNLNLPQNKILICNVSAISEEKGIDLIIEALKLLRDEYNRNDFRFFHIGGLRSGEASSPYYKTLQSKIEENNLEDLFIWMGRRNDVVEILQAFDVYVQPSRYEGLAVTLIEACAAGLPCIGSAVSGTPEIISDKINGYLIPSESSIELARRINDLISSESLRRSMGEASKEIATKHFDFDTQVNKLKEIYLDDLKTTLL